MGQLADWKCHKIVKAGKILRFPEEAGFSGPVIVEDANGAECKVECSPSVFARGRPNLGDYIVIYDDGYKSWSPAKAFEDGYTKLSPGEAPVSNRMTLVERLRNPAWTTTGLDGHFAHLHKDITLETMREAADRIEFLERMAGAVSQGESFQEIKDKVR